MEPFRIGCITNVPVANMGIHLHSRNKGNIAVITVIQIVYCRLAARRIGNVSELHKFFKFFYLWQKIPKVSKNVCFGFVKLALVSSSLHWFCVDFFSLVFCSYNSWLKNICNYWPVPVSSCIYFFFHAVCARYWLQQQRPRISKEEQPFFCCRLNRSFPILLANVGQASTERWKTGREGRKAILLMSHCLWNCRT